MLFFSPYRYRGQLYSIIYGQAIPSVIGQKSVALTPDSQQLLTGIEVIYNDYALKVLNEEAQEIMESFYSFNDESGCEFNYDAFDKRKGDLMSLIETIRSRLESINDGSFYVLDETGRFLSK